MLAGEELGHTLRTCEGRADGANPCSTGQVRNGRAGFPVDEWIKDTTETRNKQQKFVNSQALADSNILPRWGAGTRVLAG